MPLRATPSPLTPSTSPQLGVESQHQRLHRCAPDGFLAPPSEPTTPTRILRDQLLLFKLSAGTQTCQPLTISRITLLLEQQPRRRPLPWNVRLEA